MSTPQHKTRVRTHGRTLRFKKYAFLLLLGTVLISLTAATANVAGAANATQAQPLVGATTHPIQYWIGCAPSIVNTTNLNYFKDQGFTVVVVVVPDEQTYQTQLNTIKSLNMLPIIDVEMPIWDGGQLQSTPISNFSGYFQSLENAGWQYVASEGGRTGDLAYMQNYFKGYVNFNCDQCGLWKNVYIDPFTVANSWESYYPSEWPYIQNGSEQAAALGIQNGILAGAWANSGGDNQIYANSLPGGSGTPSYLSMLDWSYANGIGFTSFQVWCGDNPQGLQQYTGLHFDQIVANLQKYYPPTSFDSFGGPASFGGSWNNIGGQLASGTGPAASAQNANSLAIFVQGANGALYHKSYTGTWSSWQSLGGKLTSSPAATSPTSGVIDVFVRGGNGALYEKTTSNGGASWSSWSSLGGQIPAGTGPAACSWGAGRLDLFVQGTNGALYWKYTTNNGASWSYWTSLGGSLTSSPAATSPGNGTIDVFVRGGNGALYEKTTSNGGASWSSWSSLGGQIPAGTGPAACSWGPGRLDVFVQGANGALYHKSYIGTWSSWQSLGGSLTSSPAATSPGNGTIDVFVRGGNGALWEWT
jgi:hypothetical protein